MTLGMHLGDLRCFLIALNIIWDPRMRNVALQLEREHCSAESQCGRLEGHGVGVMAKGGGKMVFLSPSRTHQTKPGMLYIDEEASKPAIHRT